MKKVFTPLVFLASLGAGGVAVMPFVLMQYTTDHGAGLITRAELWTQNFNVGQIYYYLALEAVMLLFAALHFVLTIYFIAKSITWFKTKEAKNLIADPLKSSAILAPLISILMSMNVMIGPLRYFFPIFSSNFQSMFLPAMIFWSVMFFVVITTEIYLLGNAFRTGFDINKISFGWLLHPFVLGMLTVVGTGIAAMSKDASIANLAAFMSMISGSMGLFLLLVKMIVIFKSHFAAPTLPERNFMPSFLIVIPNITLFAISAFRFGHFLENQHAFHLGAYFYLIMGISFAFEIWYLIFGIYLMIDYFKNHHFREFYVTQWGLICPMVAFVVLGAFLHKLIMPNKIFYSILAIGMAITVIFYLEILRKHFSCARKSRNNLTCE